MIYDALSDVYGSGEMAFILNASLFAHYVLEAEIGINIPYGSCITDVTTSKISGDYNTICLFKR